MLQSGASFITKWGTSDVLQSWASVITKWNSFFVLQKRGKWYNKAEPVLESSTIFTKKWDRYDKAEQLLLRIATVITKRDNYYEVGHNM